MKYVLMFLFIMPLRSQVISTTSIEISTLPVTINVVYPWEGKNIGNVSKTFIFGNVKPYVSTITINQFPVSVYKTGSFIYYLPVSKGDCKFNIVAKNEAGISTFTRTVICGEVNFNEINQQNPFYLISPSTYTEISGEDELFISVKALKATTIYYEIDGLCEGYLDENYAGSGIYNGRCYIEKKNKNSKHSLKLIYKSGKLKGKKRKFEDIIKINDNDYIVETTTDNVVLRNNAGGYIMFMPKDVLLISDRKEGMKYRVKLGDIKLWVDADKVNLKGFKTKLFNTETGTLRFSKIDQNKVSAKLAIYQKVPFSVWEDENKLYLELYYTNLRTNWVIYDSSDNFIDNVSFKQEGSDKAIFSFSFNKNSKFWGYDISYSTDNLLNIDFKFKPEISISTQPLKGLNIIIDPGHSPKRTPPYDGGVGPSGIYEWEANLDIALKLKEKLENLGANVFMTRYTNDEKEQVPLQERPKIAKRLNGDLYLSIHNNAIPDGEDPYQKPRGFQIYYYHPHSKKLAESIHRSFLKNIDLFDEGLRFGDYHVARLTAMPSVLIENAYMILPEHEEMLMDSSFKDKLAKTIADGIVDFLK
ncbi:MAG: N-acetylmuramoyl-L-alanine amidase [Elusimicrobiota bacterium]